MNRHFTKLDVWMASKHMKRSSSSFVNRETMEMKTIMRSSSHPWGRLKWQMAISKCMGQLGISHTAGKNMKMVKTILENVSFFKSWPVPTLRSSDSTPRCYPREMETYIHKKMYTRICTAASLRAPNWKQPKCSSIEKWINKLYIHIMKCHSAHVTTQVNVQNTTQKSSKTQKSTYAIIPFIWSSMTDKTNLWW